jgi:hypothetical protein
MNTETEVRWSSEEAREMWEYIRSEIARIFTPPPHLVGAGPDVIAEWRELRMAETSYLRDLAARLLTECSSSVVTMPATSTSRIDERRIT